MHTYMNFYKLYTYAIRLSINRYAFASVRKQLSTRI